MARVDDCLQAVCQLKASQPTSTLPFVLSSFNARFPCFYGLDGLAGSWHAFFLWLDAVPNTKHLKCSECFLCGFLLALVLINKYQGVDVID